MSLYWTDTRMSGTSTDVLAALTHQGPIVCSVCGCRLVAEERMHADGEGAGPWRHFEGPPGRDARGCRIACAELLHLADGTPIA